MDEPLLRRLLGAFVLLTMAFIVASLLPKPRHPPAAAEKVVTYDLRTGEAIVTQPPEPTLPPIASTLPPSEPARRPALKVDETLGAATPGADGPREQWFVQVGSFESQQNARKVLQRLYGAGLPTVIQSVPVGKNLWYRVRVGPYPEEQAAKTALGAVQKEGYKAAKVVRSEPPGAGGN